MRAEWRSLDERINSLNDDLTEHARADEAASRLTSIPGIGVLGATALVAAVGDGEAFRRARDIPAWLGLVPKQLKTGRKPPPPRTTTTGQPSPPIPHTPRPPPRTH